MSRFDDQKAHYESLITLFKYLITITLSLFAIVGGIIAYITYADGKEMREDLRARRQELRDEAKEMKQDLKDKEEKVDKDLATLTARVTTELTLLTTKVNTDISSTRSQAINEISNVKSTAIVQAQNEARKKINDVFEDKNFDQFVESIAENRIQPKINSLVDTRIASNEKLQIASALSKLQSDDRVEFAEGLTFLQFNKSARLNGEQLQVVVNIAKDQRLDETVRNDLSSVLLYRKSDVCTAYFKDLISKREENPMAPTYAIQYFLIHNVEPTYLTNHLLSEMKKNGGPQHDFTYAVGEALKVNQASASRLFNTHALVDYLYDTLASQQMTALKAEVVRILKYYNNEGIAKGTYLFSR